MLIFKPVFRNLIASKQQITQARAEALRKLMLRGKG